MICKNPIPIEGALFSSVEDRPSSPIDKVTLFVPSSSLSAYQSTETWRGFGKILGFTDWPAQENTKLLTLRTKRSDLTVNGDYTQAKTTADISGTFDANSEQYQWAIMQHARNANYYLYNKAANKFLCKDQSMSDTPTDAVQNAPQADGTFLLYFDDTHYINMGGSNQLAINSWSTADDGNKFTITHVADWEPSEELLRLLGYGVTYHTVTVNYNVGAKTYLTTTIEVADGTTLSATHFNHLSATRDYVIAGDWDKQDAVTEDCTVNVSCTVSSDCPIVFSESIDNPVWQMVNMHSNQHNYMWSINDNEEGQPTMNVVNKGDDESYKTYVAPEAQDLWAFVGDITGFQIYNMSAGTSYVLSKTTDGDNAVSWTTPEEGTVFTAHRSASTVISNGASLLPKGHSYYLNHRGTTIQGWTARDEGSTIKVFAPDAFLQAYHAELPPYGALGTSSFFSEYNTVELYLGFLAALEANHYDVNMAWNMGKFLKSAAEADVIPTDIDAYTYYRLLNASSKTFVTSGLDDEGNDALVGGLDREAANRTAGTIVKFEKVGDNYNLYTQGLGFGRVMPKAQVLLDGAGSFAITNNGNLFSFRDVNSTDGTYNYLYLQGNNKIVGWENGETTTASKWYLVPVRELVVDLNPVGSHTYATTFLPYDFTLDPRFDVKAYKVTHAEDEVAKTKQVVDIAAYEGVILVGDTEEDTFLLLHPDAATSNFRDNILSGTTTRLTIEEEDKTSILVLGNGGKGVGFYNPSSTTLKENRAYLLADYVTGEATNGLRLEFGGETTGITATETLNNDNAPIYDLSGRRVAQPTKGIYVKGGKKIYVK